jgi:hypothetical protein
VVAKVIQKKYILVGQNRRIEGDRAENIEQSIEACKQAQESLT